jgi:hypothetical protein
MIMMVEFGDGLPTKLPCQEFTLVAECYVTREDQRTAFATHTAYPKSDSDEREQDCNTAYGKDDLISSQNRIGDRKRSCSKTTLGRAIMTGSGVGGGKGKRQRGMSKNRDLDYYTLLHRNLY